MRLAVSNGMKLSCLFETETRACVVIHYQTDRNSQHDEFLGS